MYCTQCGAEVSGDYCTYCGAKLLTVYKKAQGNKTINVAELNAATEAGKPFYQKKWFYILAASVAIFWIAVIAIIISDMNKPVTVPNQSNKSNTEINRSVSTETNKITAVRSETEAQQSSNYVFGMRKEFKEAMDSYENFMNEYVAFMKQYNADPGDWSMLASYLDFLGKYETMCVQFEKWEDDDLNEAEMAYYLEVQLRVEKKLLEVAFSLYE